MICAEYLALSVEGWVVGGLACTRRGFIHIIACLVPAKRLLTGPSREG